MRRIAIIISLLCLFTNTYSQKKISQASVNDFAENALWKYRYETNGNFRAFINTYLLKGNYGLSDVAVLMENLKTDEKGRELIFKAIHKVTGSDRDGLFNAIYAMGLKAQNAKEVSEYIYEKYKHPEMVVTPSTIRSSIGQKIYHSKDSTCTLVIAIEKGYKITIKRYEGYILKDSKKPIQTLSGIVNEADEVIIDGKVKYFYRGTTSIYSKTVTGETIAYDEYFEPGESVIMNSGIKDQ